MFIDTIPNRKSPPAVLLRESYREGGRVKKRTLANLSKLPRALIDGIAALLDGGKVSGKRAAEPGFEIVRSLPHGHVAAVKAVIGKLGLERTLQGRSGVDKRVRNLIEAMIIQRIVAPGSKLAFHRALAPMTATSSLALSVGLIEVAEREVYAALDWLIEQQTRIEAALAQRHLADGTLVLYDVSSSYMEGRCCALAKPGYSRDHRPDRPQIVYGLMCAPDGTPVAVEVFEGNTSDPQTIREQIDKIKRRFNCRTWRWSATAVWSRRRGSARNWRQPGSTGSAASGHRRSPHSPVTPGHCSSPCSTSAIWQRSPRPTFPANGSWLAAIRRWPRSGQGSARSFCRQRNVG